MSFRISFIKKDSNRSNLNTRSDLSALTEKKKYPNGAKCK